MFPLVYIRQLGLFIFISLIIVLQSCQPTSGLTTLKFQPQYDGKEIGCKDTFMIDGKVWRLSQLQFFVSNLRVLHNDNFIEVPMENNGAQSNNIALLGGVCGGNFNWNVIVSKIKAGVVKEISFDIGIPQQLNHLDPMTQPSPLNQSDMFWTWQLGHKFFRLDLSSNTEGWAFHSGSMGCKAPSPMRSPQRPCTYSNRASVKFQQFDLSQPISIDLSALLNGIELSDETRCMSSPDTESCQVLLSRLGVNERSQVFGVIK